MNKEIFITVPRRKGWSTDEYKDTVLDWHKPYPHDAEMIRFIITDAILVGTDMVTLVCEQEA